METFEHKTEDTSICIYRVKGGILYGGFFNKQPKVGDFIKSVPYFGSGMKFEVIEILSQKDATIQPECTHDPSNANMEIRGKVVFK